MMPGIMISFVFSEQTTLIVRTAPLQVELACPMQPLDDAPNWLGLQICAVDRPWRPRSQLLVLQHAGFHEAFDGAVADPPHIRAASLRVTRAGSGRARF